MPVQTSTGSSRPKNTLFCPRCGHESPADGDWCVQPGTSTDVLACPVCAAPVAGAVAHC